MINLTHMIHILIFSPLYSTRRDEQLYFLYICNMTRVMKCMSWALNQFFLLDRVYHSEQRVKILYSSMISILMLFSLCTIDLCLF
jgi:hypothetical protein